MDRVAQHEEAVIATAAATNPGEKVDGARGSLLANDADGEARRHVHDVVRRSGTSFFWGMRVLSRERREAMFAVYAFCREVDDIADEPGELTARRQELDEWRTEIDRIYAGRPMQPTARALLPAVSRYQLPREEFLAVIDGMEMDLTNSMRAPTFEELRLYCRRVAGAVGMLSVRVFGATEPQSRDLAVSLGEALQLTNILRDLDEDAARGRLYLPRELLEGHGIPAASPPEVLRHPALPMVCRDLAALARERFAESEALIAQCDRRRLRPSIVMMEIYRRILDRLEHRGWKDIDRDVTIGTGAKLALFMRHGFL